MPHGFTAFERGCPGLAALGFVFDDSGCDIEGAGYALYLECGIACATEFNASVVYDGGTQNAGPAIRIRTGSRKNAFHGLVALYIPSQNGIALVLYRGESLVGLGTIIATHSITLNVDDVLLIESAGESVATYRVDVNSTTIMSGVITADMLSPLDKCDGFVVVRNVPGGTIP